MDENLVYETLLTLDEYLVKLEAGIRQAVDHFRGQREDTGLRLLTQIIEGLQWVIEVVSLTKGTLESHGIQTKIEEINGILTELLNAVENQDYVLVSDILEYEIVELIDSWKMELQKIIPKMN